MPASPRPPSFLQGLESPDAAVRPAAFAASSPAAGKVRPALTPAQREPPPAPGPTPEQLEAVRAEAARKVAQGAEALRREAQRLAEVAADDAIELAFRVARRLLEAELSTSPEAFRALIRAALKRAGDSRKVSLRVHPQAAQALPPSLAADAGLASAAVEVVADASLAPWDCVVETDFGKLDGRLDTRLDELRRAAGAAEEEPA